MSRHNTNACRSQQVHRLNLRPSSTADILLCSHRDIEKAIRESACFSNPNYGADLAHELRLLFADFLRHGVCSFSTSRLRGQYGSAAEWAFSRFIRTSGLLTKITAHIFCGGERKCAKYVFELKGLQKTAFALSSSVRKEVNSLRLENGFGRTVRISGEWFGLRCEGWLDWCQKNNLEPRFDWTGRTFVGEAVQFAIKSLGLPEVTAEDLATLDSDTQEDWYAAHFQSLLSGVEPTVSTKRHRVYHGLISTPKKLFRERLLMQYNGVMCETKTVDSHASYWSLLIGHMEIGEERDRLIAIQQTGHFYETLANLAGVSAADVKSEVQRQCLFWRDSRLEQRPLWVSMLDHFPHLSGFIMHLRDRYGVGGLSDWLTHLESRIFIKGALLETYGLGIPCLPFHDGLLVPEMEAERVREIINKHATAALGYTPLCKIG